MIDQLGAGSKQRFVVRHILSKGKSSKGKPKVGGYLEFVAASSSKRRDHQKSKLHWPKEESTCMISGKLAGIGQSYSPFVGAHVISSELSAKAVAASQPMRWLLSNANVDTLDE